MDDTKKTNIDLWSISELLTEIPILMQIYLKATLKKPANTLVPQSCELLEGR